MVCPVRTNSFLKQLVSDKTIYSNIIFLRIIGICFLTRQNLYFLKSKNNTGIAFKSLTNIFLSTTPVKQKTKLKSLASIFGIV
jgi:ABC-type siderophore export system fused ATPase/permease subunit